MSPRLAASQTLGQKKLIKAAASGTASSCKKSKRQQERGKWQHGAARLHNKTTQNGGDMAGIRPGIQRVLPTASVNRANNLKAHATTQVIGCQGNKGN
jgi:hypothetical protein